MIAGARAQIGQHTRSEMGGDVYIKCVATPDELKDDTKQLLDELDRELFPEDVPYNKAGCYWWIAYNDKTPVGFAGLKVLDGVNKGLGFLCRAGIKRSARASGLQRRLIRVRERKARALGLKSLITYTARHNFASTVNLIKTGYRLTIPNWYYGGATANYFEKKL